MQSPRLSVLLLVLTLASPAAAQTEGARTVDGDATTGAPPWALPPPSACSPPGGLAGWPPGEDAAGVPFQPGDGFQLSQLETLKNFVPPELWVYRERFFHEGMRLEIGACFADYGPPEFYRTATETFRGRTRLLPNGGIENYTAGQPFPMLEIAPDDPLAGLKWAWNSELRYQGAGFWTPFRTVDMVGRDGKGEPFEGETFKAHLSFRSDLANQGYTAPAANGNYWVAGGKLAEPTDAREHAWRQYRNVDALKETKRSDDLHAYLPNYRRVRRVSGVDVEGVYMPSFSVGVVKSSVIAGIGGGLDGGAAGGAAAGGAATSITTKRSGFEVLETRPLLYDYRLVGTRDVLTPINASRPSYPQVKDRDFGIWGLSFATDRWDLRRAVVVEGRYKGHTGGTQVARFVLYIDAQTGMPLYYMSFDSRDERIDVGMFVGRWSEERSDYRRWPGNPALPVRVIDSVGESFANIAEDGGWRRESWTAVSTPPDDKTLKRELSVNSLSKGR
jgi:hypothetical protein